MKKNNAAYLTSKLSKSQKRRLISLSIKQALDKVKEKGKKDK
ncbi:hypothetical protein [Desulfobacula sp.]|jgi:hypothetical protein